MSSSSWKTGRTCHSHDEVGLWPVHMDHVVETKKGERLSERILNHCRDVETVNQGSRQVLSGVSEDIDAGKLAGNASVSQDKGRS